MGCHMGSYTYFFFSKVLEYFFDRSIPVTVINEIKVSFTDSSHLDW
jgi:hypothetical protein